MSMEDIYKKESLHWIVLILLSIVQIGAASLYLNHLSKIDNWSACYAEDSHGYLQVARYFQGEVVPADKAALFRYRLFNPVIPFTASVLGRFIGIERAFLIINFILWNITAMLFYALLKVLFKDSATALLGGAVFTTSMPCIEWGLPIMVDMGAYFFVSLILLLYLKGENSGAFYKAFLGIWIGIAILTKPTLIILLVFVFISSIYNRKFVDAALICVLALAPVFAVYSIYHLTLQDFSEFGYPRHQGIVYLLSAAFFCFHWGWVFFLYGWKAEHEHRKLYALYLIAFMVPYLFFVHNPRLFFLIYPAVIPSISKGMAQWCASFRNKGRIMACALCAYIVTSNLLTVFHLYVMRTLRIRDWEGLIKFLV